MVDIVPLRQNFLASCPQILVFFLRMTFVVYICTNIFHLKFQELSTCMQRSSLYHYITPAGKYKSAAIIQLNKEIGNDLSKVLLIFQVCGKLLMPCPPIFIRVLFLLFYNVPFLGSFWTFLPTLKSDVINGLSPYVKDPKQDTHDQKPFGKVQLFWEGHKNCSVILMVLTFTK